MPEASINDFTAAVQSLHQGTARHVQTVKVAPQPGAPAEWPAFDAETDQRLQLDASWEQLDHFRADECAFWRQQAGVE